MLGTCIFKGQGVGSQERIKGIFLDWCKITSIQLIFSKGKQRQMLRGAEAGHKKNTFS